MVIGSATDNTGTVQPAVTNIRQEGTPKPHLVSTPVPQAVTDPNMSFEYTYTPPLQPQNGLNLPPPANKTQFNVQANVSTQQESSGLKIGLGADKEWVVGAGGIDVKKNEVAFNMGPVPLFKVGEESTTSSFNMAFPPNSFPNCMVCPMPTAYIPTSVTTTTYTSQFVFAGQKTKVTSYGPPGGELPATIETQNYYNVGVEFEFTKGATIGIDANLAFPWDTTKKQ